MESLELRRRAGWLLAIALLTSAFMRAEDGDCKSGAIVGIIGTWKQCENTTAGKPCNGKSPDLRFTGPIRKDDFVEAKDKNNSLVVLLDGKSAEPVSYRCEHPACDDTCPKVDNEFSCVLRVSCPHKTGMMQNLAAVILPLFVDSPARYVTPVSRGIEPALSDSVVLLQDNRIDFAPAFQEMDPATYRLRLEPLSNSAQPGAPMQIQWSGSGTAIVFVPGVHTGLYRLVRLGTSGEPAGPDAWVLVSGPDRFSKDAKAFQSAIGATKEWPDDVDARAPRAVLRAYLDTLSRQALKEE